MVYCRVLMEKTHCVGLILLSTASSYCLSQIADIHGTNSRRKQTHRKQDDGDEKGEKHEEATRI